MAQEKLCSKCGDPVSDELAGGCCTACLLAEGLSPAELAQNPIALRYFGDYELIEEIARGGMGVVFKARQRSLNRIVAVKMILSGHLASEAQAQRFRAEARAAAALQHPGIVAIHEVGEHEGLLFFSMDYVAGQNLAQKLRDGPWAAARAAQCVHEIAEAIQYAHEQRVLHRDLKPSNVLIDANGRAHVTDFGLAKQLTSDSGRQSSDLTLSGQVIGSPNFMPPEQAAGKHRELTPASDVYSLGAILYHCLTGRPPFEAETLAQTLWKVAEQEPVLPRSLNARVPRDLETICLQCLEKDPKRRYTTAQELADETGRFLSDKPIHARPVSLAPKIRRWCWRNKAWAVAGMAVLLLLLTVVWYLPLRTQIHRYSREIKRLETEVAEKKAGGEVVPAKASLKMHIATSQGIPIQGALCTLVVGGYPSGNRGLPLPPKAENRMSSLTDAKGNAIFRHDGLQSLTRHVAYVESSNYSGATLFLDRSAVSTGIVSVLLFKPRHVTLRYAFQPSGDLNFHGQDVVSGRVTLYPMNDGSYRPPARAHFSFKQNIIVGSSGVLDTGIEIDQRGGVLYFGGSRGRFDHCTDLGRVSFEATTTVDPSKLERVREDTRILPGHTYIYESNIYPPAQRTQFTGFDLVYAKIFVESVEED